MAVRFLHLSDFHYLRDYEGKGKQYCAIVNAMDDPFSQLRSLLKKVSEPYDFVIISGDICEFGDTQDYAFFRRRLKRLFHDVPVFITTGNHDLRESFCRGYLKKEPELPLFSDDICDGIRIIMLDSSDEKHQDGIITDESCGLLEKALKKKTGLPTLLVTHHHLIEEQFSMPAASYPQRLKDIIADSEITAVLTGHTHHPYRSSFCGKPYFTAGSLSFVADESGEGKLRFYQHPSLSVFSIENGAIECETISSDRKDRTLAIWDL
ncbi:MAG: metallophosphoesterase [Erysipelotrichaceae bacterium]|nr:metallophosphoesterase [Erysipelotrichaceae bacterium]